MLAICLMFINGICEAADCFDLAGRDYKIDPDLLRAISWKESRYRVNAIGINPVTGYGSGKRRKRGFYLCVYRKSP